MLAVGQPSATACCWSARWPASPGACSPCSSAPCVQTLLGLVEAGLGVAAVPQLALRPGDGALVVVPLAALAVHRVVQG